MAEEVARHIPTAQVTVDERTPSPSNRPPTHCSPDCPCSIRGMWEVWSVSPLDEERRIRGIESQGMRTNVLPQKWTEVQRSSLPPPPPLPLLSPPAPTNSLSDNSDDKTKVSLRLLVHVVHSEKNTRAEGGASGPAGRDPEERKGGRERPYTSSTLKWPLAFVLVSIHAILGFTAQCTARPRNSPAFIDFSNTNGILNGGNVHQPWVLQARCDGQIITITMVNQALVENGQIFSCGGNLPVADGRTTIATCLLAHSRMATGSNWIIQFAVNGAFVTQGSFFAVSTQLTNTATLTETFTGTVTPVATTFAVITLTNIVESFLETQTVTSAATSLGTLVIHKYVAV
ncbi:hypothetical protein BDK51DRAFT_52885 [Blyttiomyces helicus]|uniref:Uncharacterized protein n=1 Tax=Blyttiomyces helicus TaxID=388810 RepID=A0A4P9VU16_9FUNG|nr:hypothetical protein BDK51DRAFT_52885 [Blyttiomyces helicus]|eukprot:RKO83044.1 hypothetical protein BDK51DRAFT_52885 [Blyttiomyces helicus]